MPAQVYNIRIDQGATFRLTLRWVDDLDQSLIPAGATARMQVRPTHASDEVLLDMTTENGGITVDEGEGRIDVRGEAAVTALMPAPAQVVYDLEVEAPDGTVDRLIEGFARVMPEVTR